MAVPYKDFIPGPEKSPETVALNMEITPEHERIFNELRSKYYEMRNDPEFGNNFDERCADFKERLFGLPGGIDAATGRYLSHIFGSTITEEDKITAFDFLGENSIIKFIDKEYQEFKKQRQTS